MMVSGVSRWVGVMAATVALTFALVLCGCGTSGSGSAAGSSVASSSASATSQQSSSAEAGSFEAALDKALGYARSQDVAQGEGFEWLALSLARTGDDVSAPPLSDFAKAIEERVKSVSGVLDERSSTEYSKTILALTAVGVDASDVAGYNLFEGLSDMDFVELQGVNGPIWALTAVSSKAAYEIPESADAKNPASRDALVKAVLDAQGEDGGWPYMGNPEDEGAVDLTAMALTALSPYADGADYPEVPEAIERGIAFLSEAQLAEGGFDGGSGATSESAAQVTIALCSLGIDPGTDERFAKGNASLLDNLVSFQDETGAFSHVAGEPANDVATDQALEALVAIERFRTGKSALYSMDAA